LQENGWLRDIGAAQLVGAVNMMSAVRTTQYLVGLLHKVLERPDMRV
jgi:hypothetical protein